LDELDRWVDAKAAEWKVSAVTITTNMGLDNRGSRAPNFWNIFQSVFWDRALKEQPEIANTEQKSQSEYHRLCKTIHADATVISGD